MVEKHVGAFSDYFIFIVFLLQGPEYVMCIMPALSSAWHYSHSQQRVSIRQFSYCLRTSAGRHSQQRQSMTCYPSIHLQDTTILY